MTFAAQPTPATVTSSFKNSRYGAVARLAPALFIAAKLNAPYQGTETAPNSPTTRVISGSGPPNRCSTAMSCNGARAEPTTARRHRRKRFGFREQTITASLFCSPSVCSGATDLWAIEESFVSLRWNRTTGT